MGHKVGIIAEVVDNVLRLKHYALQESHWHDGCKWAYKQQYTEASDEQHEPKSVMQSVIMIERQRCCCRCCCCMSHR